MRITRGFLYCDGVSGCQCAKEKRRTGDIWVRCGGGLFLLSRPRGALGSGAAAVEPAADSVVARFCVGGFGWVVVYMYSFAVKDDLHSSRLLFFPPAEAWFGSET